MNRVHAIVMTGNSRRGFIEFNGHKFPKCYVPLPDSSNPASNVINALNSSRSIESIAVIGPEDYFDTVEIYQDRQQKDILWIPQKDGASFSDNLCDSYSRSRELGLIKSDEGALYLAGDTPFRTFRSIDEVVRQISPEFDLVIPLIPGASLEDFFRYAYQKPLVPVALPNSKDISWYKADELVYARIDKMPKEDMETLYNRRKTNRAIWVFEMFSYGFRNPELASILVPGWILKQVHRLTRDLPKAINTPFCFNRFLNSERMEQIVRESHLRLNVHMFQSTYPEGYLDIDSQRDFRVISKNFNRLDGLIHHPY
jgi:hypothetical protein